MILRLRVYRLTTPRISSAQPHMLKYNFFSVESVSEFCIRLRNSQGKRCLCYNNNLQQQLYLLYHELKEEKWSFQQNQKWHWSCIGWLNYFHPNVKKVLRERGHDDFILPRVKTKRFKRAFENRCLFKLSLNIFQLKSFFNFVIHMIGFFYLSLVHYWL